MPSPAKKCSKRAQVPRDMEVRPVVEESKEKQALEERPTTLLVEESASVESEDEGTEVWVDTEEEMLDEESWEDPSLNQLQPGPPPPSQVGAGPPPLSGNSGKVPPSNAASAKCANTFTLGQDHFSREETMFIFDWDDTVLPSSWVQSQGLRLDNASVVSEKQAAQLAEVAKVAACTLRAAKRHGTVVLVTNAERGWIELSCQKFLPTLSPSLENVRIVSARTTYEGSVGASPLDWKLSAFDVEINRHFSNNGMTDKYRRKNVFSLGDSIHEREALLRATASSPNCRSKSLKFVERPDISQLLKQHELIVSSFEQMIHYDGTLDLCLRCP